jgi:subtilisin family serine protease
MKKIVTFLLLILCHLNSFAQLGYWCESKFITLTPDESCNYKFIQAMDTGSQKILKELSASKVTMDNSIRELSDNRFYVDKDYRLPKMDYYESTIYKSSEGETIVVLPRIVISLIDGYHIENVLRRLDNNVKVESSERDRYILSCQMRTSEEVLQAVRKLSGLEGIRYFEPEVFLKVTPCNTLYPYQYYLNNTSTGGVDINVVPAWAVTTGSSSVTIAVIDDGVESNHEDLSGRVLQGFTVDNSTGYGLPQNENDYNVKAHGTACAGIIAANDNNIGIRGIASSSNILPVNLFPYYEDDENFRCSNIEIANAIRWAYVRADVLNIADVYPNSYDIYSAICDALTYGRGGKGCVIVAAAGNSGAFTSEVARPARYDGVIAVGAVLSDGTIWTWSQGGNCLDVVAPGGNFVGQGNIVTTDRTAPKGYVNYSNYTNTFGATSASCAEVSGIAALMLSVNSNLTTTQVRDALRSTATDLGTTGFDTTYGYGLVNAAKAVLSVMSLNIVGASTISDSESYYVDNLPLGFNVVWSLSDSFYNTYCLQQNTPFANTCTITRDNFYDMTDATLTASIMYNGTTVYSVTKNVSTQGYFLSSYNNAQINVSLIGYESISDRSVTRNTDRGLSAETVSWSLTVYNAKSGEKVFCKEVTGSSCIINTTGWKPGVYVVKGIIGDNVMSEKVVVR